MPFGSLLNVPRQVKQQARPRTSRWQKACRTSRRQVEWSNQMYGGCSTLVAAAVRWRRLLMCWHCTVHACNSSNSLSPPHHRGSMGPALRRLPLLHRSFPLALYDWHSAESDFAGHPPIGFVEDQQQCTSSQRSQVFLNLTDNLCPRQAVRQYYRKDTTISDIDTCPNEMATSWNGELFSA